MDYKYKEINGKTFARVIREKDVFEKKGVKIQFPDDIDMQVAIIRIEGELFALRNICPHRHADQIYNGIIKEGNLMCPLHGWTYNIKTGQNVNSHQGVKSLKTYEIFSDEGWVWVEKPKLEIPKWRQEGVSLGFAGSGENESNA